MNTLQSARGRWLALVAVLAVGPALAQDSVRVSWPVELDPLGRGPLGPRQEIEPVVAGDILLVPTGIRLHGFDTESLALRWTAGPPRGWEELDPRRHRKLLTEPNTRDLHLRAAGGHGVAVAALQLPVGPEKLEARHAERRLFAFALADGEPRWDHGSWPPDGRDMHVVAPPIVSGPHVVVACATGGTAPIDYHVAAHRLADGALEWRTHVVDGIVQVRESGHPALDFTAPPLVAAPGGEVVIAQTDLGVVAALDASTGAVLWRTEYEPIPFPKRRSYHLPIREQVWRACAPLVVGDLVLAAPTDLHELLALDLVDGRIRWRRRHAQLVALAGGDVEPGLDQLVAAGEEALVLGGGPRLAALTPTRGLGADAAPTRAWDRTVGAARARFLPRIRFDGTTAYLPREDACLRIDVATGTELEPLDLPAPLGLLVTDEAIYALDFDSIARCPR